MELNGTTANVKPNVAVAGKRTALRALTFALLGILATIFAAMGLGSISLNASIILAFGASLVIALASLAIRSKAAFAVAPEDPLSDEDLRIIRYDAVLDAFPQPILLLDSENRVELSNAAAKTMFGDLREGVPITSVLRAPSALEVLREARHERSAREEEFTLSIPTPMTALLYASPVKLAGRDSDDDMIVMVRDRTEQKMLERMRSDFLANAGHELRTPLASLLGFIETLQGHAKDDAAAREKFLKIMETQTERMLRLVKDLVSLSTLELNERRLPEDEVDLCEVAQSTREMMAPVVKSQNGELVPGPTDCSAEIIGDRDQITQVIQNLVENSLRYGAQPDRPARVHVTVGFGASSAFDDGDKGGDNPEQIAVRTGCRTSDLVYLRVRDEGLGIDPNDLPRITERFYRTDVNRARTVEGTGLGLAIVKHIVGRHKGGIQIESSPGKGAAFTCYFPPASVAMLDKNAKTD